MDDARPALRQASPADAEALVALWGLLDDTAQASPWREHARAWFLTVVGQPSVATFPVVEVDGVVVATAVGTLETGAPNPWCPRGRTVRLADLVTLPPYRRMGWGTALVQDVVAWARSVEADRVDLSASAAGVGVYERCGFVRTSAPRMKLVL